MIDHHIRKVAHIESLGTILIHEEQRAYSIDDSFVLGQHLHENLLLRTHLVLSV